MVKFSQQFQLQIMLMSLYMFVFLTTDVSSFTTPKIFNSGHGIRKSFQRLSSASSSTTEEDMLTEINSMRVREIKKELEIANINTSDVFEKDELVKRLVKYRTEKKSNGGPSQEKPASTGTGKTRGKKSSSLITRVPMNFHSLTPDQSVAAKNANVFLRPSPGKYPSIQLSIPGNNRPLTLLVDTACSGIVVRPHIVNQYNLPPINVGVSMTAAGGTTTGASTSRMSKAVMDDGTVLDEMIVVGQDIGALPNILDGIIGLSFLNQFKSAVFDFEHGELVLSKNLKDSGMDFSQMEVVAENTMKLCRIGVWVVDAQLDGRGPVKMLLDTGAASTFLNWKGAKDLNLDRSHPLVSRNANPIGAMGADNQALELSHRFVLKQRINLISDPSTVGAFGPLGLDIKEMGPMNVDIGDLPVLEALKSDDVGGILGSDILMRCDALHLELETSMSGKISMWKKKSL